MKPEKQKWINKNAINDWEIENTQKAARIVDEYYDKQHEKFEQEEAKNIQKYGEPFPPIEHL